MSPSICCGLGQVFAKIRNFCRKPAKPEISQLRIVRLHFDHIISRDLLTVVQGSPYDFRRVVHFDSPDEDGSHVITVNGNV